MRSGRRGGRTLPYDSELIAVMRGALVRASNATKLCDGGTSASTQRKTVDEVRPASLHALIAER